MDKVQRMKGLAGEIRVMMNSKNSTGEEIAAKLADLTHEGRGALGIRGDIDITFDAKRSEYVMTLSRTPPGDSIPMKASVKMQQRSPGCMPPPLHLDVVYSLNRLDSILTREERIHARR